MKKWVWIAIVLIAVLGIFFFFQENNNRDTVKDIKTAVVTRSDLSLTVAATGVVTPFIEVEVKSKAGGEIISFPFEEGESLKKGEVAVRLDPKIERSQVNQANADLLMAEARLEKARIHLKDAGLRLKRQKSLFDDKVISKQDMDDVIISYEKAQSDIKIARAELIRSRETLNEAEDRLRDTEIKAPLTGTILKKYVEEGQVISSTLSSASEGTLIFTMADLNRIYIRAMVDETDIGSVRPGQEVMITVDAYPGEVFNGKVLRLAPKGRVESTITVFDVVIEVSGQDRTMLKPVMTANVEILTDFRKDVLLIPAEAIRMKDGKTGVYKLEDDKPLWSPVKTGKSDGILTEIQGTLKEKDEIVISGPRNQKSGSDRTRNLRRGFWFFRKRK